MKILLLVHASYLDPERIATGNSVRATLLARGLAEGGHEVVFVFPRGLEKFSSAAPPADGGIRLQPYDDRGDLSRLLGQERPDALWVGYWELLDQLPEIAGIPILLDVVAPRILEAMFQADRDMGQEIAETLRLFRRADYFFVGTERQRHFLLPWLIMAGFDCRFDVPVAVLPISLAAVDEPAPRLLDAGAPLRLVSGGVDWPWRQTRRWFDALVGKLEQLPAGRACLTLFSGSYLYGSEGDGRVMPAGETVAPALVESGGLLTYQDMQTYLQHECHVGIELADRNIEREYSQSFRAMEYLRAGLPVLCCDYLELAGKIVEHDAGWVIRDPAELPALLDEILADPDVIRRKSLNALRLAASDFDYRVTVRPVLDFLASPRPARRLPPPVILEPVRPASGESSPVVAVVSGWARKKNCLSRGGNGLKRAFAKAGRLALTQMRALGQWRRHRQGIGDVNVLGNFPDILMVTRSDIFPPDHGAAVKIERTAHGLSRVGGQVFLVTDDRTHYQVFQNGEMTSHSYPRWLSWLSVPRPWAMRRLLARGIPVSDAFLYLPLSDWGFVLRTLYLAWRQPVRLFIAEFPAYARACLWGRSLFGGKVMLVEHNVEYQRLGAQYPDMPPHGLEYLRDVEVTLCNQVDRVIAVSEPDRQTLLHAGVLSDKLMTIPHGVDLAGFDKSQALDLHQHFSIPGDTAILVYHGTYLYPPNLEAMQVMAERILPRLREAGVRCKVVAIGRHPPAETLDEDILFTGPVAAVAPYLKGADLAIVPLLQGGGTRMKILDYFAAGLPVVSSAKGIEGIPVHPGETAWVVNDVDASFVEAIRTLLTDRERARALGRSGREFVESLDWEAIARRYLSAA